MHTGQHYDDELSRVFFDELGVPAPDRQLDAGQRLQHASRPRACSPRWSRCSSELGPDLVLVYGDTNSTLAGALAAAQAAHPGGARGGGHALLRPRDARGAQPRAHRPRERPAALLHADGGRQPARARRAAGEVHLVGDVMADVSLAFRAIAAERSTRARRPRPRARRLPAASPRTARATWTTPDRLRAARGAARGAARARRCSPSTRAPRPAWTPPGCSSGSTRRTRRAHAAARLPRLPQAGPQRPRRAHRLRRGAEGGLPARRALRDPARHHRVGRDGGGGLERARGPRPRGARCAALERHPPAERPELYGGGRAAERVRDVVSAYTPPP